MNGYATDAAMAGAVSVSAKKFRRPATDSDSVSVDSVTDVNPEITSARRRFGASRVGASETFPAILPRRDRASGASTEPLDVPPGAVAARVVGVVVAASDVLRGVARTRRTDPEIRSARSSASSRPREAPTSSAIASSGSSRVR